jgi:anaerobic ribonucleoside-triphosphate reductase activating protein
LRCPGCCNPELLSFTPRAGTRLLTAAAVLAEVPDDVEGVSFLGGEPTAPAHAPVLARVAQEVRARGQTVMVFSGYTLAELRARASAEPDVGALLAATDLLVDGRYVEGERTTARRWIGSDNQVLHFLTDRYAPGDPRFGQPNTIELRIVGGAVVVNGFPVRGART